MLHRFLLSIGFLSAMNACAQAAYRWEDPATGRTVYSDQTPPAGAKNPVPIDTREEPSKKTSSLENLPYATRVAAEKYPVKFYSTTDCGESCANARAFLAARHAPFTEIALDKLSEEDFQKTARQIGSSTPTIPLLTVGTQKLVGFEKNMWNEMLDLAGYPRTEVSSANPSLTETNFSSAQ
ncbi:MAG: DUF4124 domain-containing protein [Candidatus Accumulibacter sp.]|jgi:glutaredoxin|nr:DUF4124 domain-containing protein [Accumulibacter sp.]